MIQKTALLAENQFKTILKFFSNKTEMAKLIVKSFLLDHYFQTEYYFTTCNIRIIEKDLGI